MAYLPSLQVSSVITKKKKGENGKEKKNKAPGGQGRLFVKCQCCLITSPILGSQVEKSAMAWGGTVLCLLATAKHASSLVARMLFSW